MRELWGHPMPSPSPGHMQPPAWSLISAPSPVHPGAPQPAPPDLHPSTATSHCSAAHTSLSPASPGSLLQPQCLLSAMSSPLLLPAMLWGCALQQCHTGSHTVLGPGRAQRGGKSGGSGVLGRAVAHGGRRLRVGQKWDRTGSMVLLSHSPPVLPGTERSGMSCHRRGTWHYWIAGTGAAAWAHGTPKPHTEPPPQNRTGWCCPWSRYCQPSSLRKAGSSPRNSGWEHGVSRSRSSAPGPEGSAIGGTSRSGAAWNNPGSMGVWAGVAPNKGTLATGTPVP